MNHDFPTLSRTGISFHLTFSLLSSSHFSSFPGWLLPPTIHIVGSFTSKFPANEHKRKIQPLASRKTISIRFGYCRCPRARSPIPSLFDKMRGQFQGTVSLLKRGFGHGNRHLKHWRPSMAHIAPSYWIGQRHCRILPCFSLWSHDCVVCKQFCETLFLFTFKLVARKNMFVLSESPSQHILFCFVLFCCGLVCLVLFSLSWHRPIMLLSFRNDMMVAKWGYMVVNSDTDVLPWECPLRAQVATGPCGKLNDVSELNCASCRSTCCGAALPFFPCTFIIYFPMVRQIPFEGFGCPLWMSTNVARQIAAQQRIVFQQCLDDARNDSVVEILAHKSSLQTRNHQHFRAWTHGRRCRFRLKNRLCFNSLPPKKINAR